MSIVYLGQEGVTGRINKGWYLIDGVRYLAKGNSPRTVGSMGEVGYQPYSEVMATKIAEYLGIPHVPYALGNISDFKEVKTFGIKHVSLCQDYGKKGYTISTLKNFKDKFLKCKKSELIPKMIEFGIDVRPLYNILIFDAIIGNIDRHLNNIELFISADRVTVQLTKYDVAYVPIYDNGASFCGDDPRLMMFLKNVPLLREHIDFARPFEFNHKKQLRIIPREYLDLISSEKGKLYNNVISIVDSVANGNIPPVRYALLKQNIAWRIANIEKLLEGNVCN